MARGVRALRKIMDEVRDNSQAADFMGKEFDKALPADERLVNFALEKLEDSFLDDAVLRAARSERLSWYHFSQAERVQIERIFKVFRVGPSLHRTEVYAALRRFGCRVSVTQARFLVHEFDIDGSGLLSLKQFIGLCARAQLYQSGEENPFAANIDNASVGGPDSTTVGDTSATAAALKKPATHQHRSKGLSMIEVRALREVFDSVDARGGTIGSVPHFPNDGLLERSQLATAIQLGGYNPTQTELDEYMETFDPDGTGWITRQEFLLIMGRLPTQQGTFSTQQYAKVLQLFDMYDPLSSGIISVPDLKVRKSIVQEMRGVMNSRTPKGNLPSFLVSPLSYALTRLLVPPKALVWRLDVDLSKVRRTK